MDESPFPWWFERFIAPRALLVGVVLSFAACCVAGYLTTRHNYLSEFTRFHPLLSPESLYYPTASQVRKMARSRLDPDKVVVIVGGSSILHGSCQEPSRVWSDRLQSLLGEDYQVLNLALRCGRTMEIGAIAAEFLQRDYKKLLLITDTQPGLMAADPDGLLFRYFFWDAYYRGLLIPDPARMEQLAAGLAKEEQFEQSEGIAAARKEGLILAESRRELQREMALNRGLYFCDLWNTLAYTEFHTLWTPLSRSAFARPRKDFRDPDPGGLPLPVRYNYHFDHEMERVREHLAIPAVKQDADGRWVPDLDSVVWPRLEEAALTSFPEPTRKRTLVVVPWYSPFYREHLTGEEQARYAAMSAFTVQRLRQLGFSSVAVGEGFDAADYGDLVHMVASGGAKMADALAPQVRALAERLGYLKGGTRP